MPLPMTKTQPLVADGSAVQLVGSLHKYQQQSQQQQHRDDTKQAIKKEKKQKKQKNQSDGVTKDIQLVVLGHGGIGCKSALCIRFVRNVFASEYNPTVEDTYQRHEILDGRTIRYDILDTPGQEEYSAMLPQMVRDKEGFLIGYAVTSRMSYDDVDRFVRVVRNHEPHTGPGAPTRPIVFIGNRIDLKHHQLSFADGVRLAERHGGNCFMHMSVKENINCALAFQMAARLVLEYREAAARYKESTSIGEYFSKSELANPPVGGSSSVLHELMLDEDLNVELIRKVLDASPSHVVHWRDDQGCTPLHLLASRNRVKDEQSLTAAIKLLLERGADPLALNEHCGMAWPMITSKELSNAQRILRELARDMLNFP